MARRRHKHEVAHEEVAIAWEESRPMKLVFVSVLPISTKGERNSAKRKWKGETSDRIERTSNYACSELFGGLISTIEEIDTIIDAACWQNPRTVVDSG